MTTLKEWMDAQWQAKGVKCANHGTAWLGNDVHSIHARAGTARNYKSKEQKAYEARFAIYNKKLAPVILAEATRDDRFSLPRYSWPKHEKAASIEQAPAIPRKRVSKAKLEQAAAIIAKVPEDELATFLARFGLSLSLAAHLVALGDPTMIARQFLRATL